MMFFQVPMLAVVILQLTFLVGWGFDYSRTADKGSEIETIIHRIPKIELHAHLHGSVRHSTLLELINQQNLSIEISKVRLDENDVGVRDKPFELFPVVHRVVNNIEIVQRVLREMVEDYLTENTLYLEIRTSPRVLVGDGTTIGEYVRTVTELIAELNKEYAKTIVTKLILSIDRSKSLQEGRMIYELAKQYQYVGKEKVIVGMDFAGNPQGGKFEDFRQLFETIRDDGFNITVHIAEAKELSQSSGFDLEDDETSTILQFL